MAEEKVRKLIEELVNEAKARNITREHLVEMLDAYYYSIPENSIKMLKAKAVIKDMVAEMDFLSQTRRLFAINFFYLAYEWQDKGFYVRQSMAKELAIRSNMSESATYTSIGDALYSAKRYLEKKSLYMTSHPFHKRIDCNQVLKILITQINTLVEERN